MVSPDGKKGFKVSQIFARYRNYFTLAIVKYLDQKQLKEGRASIILWFQRNRVHDGGEDRARGGESNEITFLLHAGSTEREQEAGYRPPVSTPRGCTSKGSITSQTVSPIGDHVSIQIHEFMGNISHQCAVSDNTHERKKKVHSTTAAQQCEERRKLQGLRTQNHCFNPAPVGCISKIVF